MKKALITGNTGYLGRFLVEEMESDYQLFFSNSKENNLLENDLSALEEVELDFIFHCAVKTAAGGYCQKHPGEQFLINQKMNNNTLEFWQKHQSQAKFITFGSSCSYNDNVKKVEENYLEGTPETGYEVYGMIKRMLLVGLRAFEDEYNMKYSFFIPSTLYGENYDLHDRHFIYDLIRKICTAKYKGEEPVVLWGTGDQRRELIYVRDAIKVILNKVNDDDRVINLSTGIDFSIKDYARTICDIVDYDFDKITFDTTKLVGAKEKKIYNGKIKDQDFTDLRDGLKKTVDFYLESYM
jgi:GDP-L-fucose synthase